MADGQTIALPASVKEEANARVCIDVDSSRFKRFFMERILRS